jgi:polyketide biosynthesis enoyl-CoA hydratase PksI
VSTDVLDRLERGEIDIERALASFEGESPKKIVLSNVSDERPQVASPAPRRIRLDAVDRAVVELSIDEHGIALVMMRDDDAANMFTPDLLAGLRKSFSEIERRPEAKVVVVTGTDTWFCCGGTPEDLARMRDGRASFFGIDGFRLLLDCSLPTIAAMQGHAVGGGLTFGLYADVTLLSQTSYYSANFMEHGLTPGIGTTYLLPKKLGAALGAEMMLTAQRYQGRDLAARGVHLEVLEKGAVLERAFAIAREMAKSPRRQLELLKRRSTEETLRELPRVLREEDSMHAQCFPRPKHRRETYATLRVERRAAFWSITLNKSSIDEALLDDLHGVLDEIEGDASTKGIVIRGRCTGLDFQATAMETITSRFMALMTRMSSMPRIIVTLVDGDVMAGGVGLVAASDFVLATPKSTFALTEALWGLLPAMVLPFLIRRIGFGNAYAMTLSTDTIGADAARAMRLVDEVIDGEGVIEKRLRRFERLETSTIGAIKAYFRELWNVDEERAVSEIDRLLSDADVQKRMKDFTTNGRLPWE